MRNMTGLERANLATIHITSVFSNFHGNLTEAMKAEIMENAATIESILKAKKLFDAELAEKYAALEKTGGDFGEVKRIALDFATASQRIIEQKMAA